MDCYIIHYTKNENRKKYMEETILPKLQEKHIKNFYWITDFDRETPFIQAIPTTHTTSGNLSCNKKHYEAWKLFGESGEEYCLVLEDDVLFEKGIDFTKEFQKVLDMKKSDDIVISIGSGIQRHGKKKGMNKEKDGRCTDSYILHKSFLPLFNGHEEYTLNIGHYMNRIMKKAKLMWTWYEPTIFTQGSQNGTYITDIRDF
jgi:GR25 family glycosyltransferase involved in LPS biosynthesis